MNQPAKRFAYVFTAFILALCNGVFPLAAFEDANKKILKEGLLGAATGAIASSASGGKAGKAALIGAGTNVIGGALLDTVTGSSSQGQPVPAYAAPYSAPPVGTYYRAQQPVYYEEAPVYYVPPREDPNKKILKQGLLGAGTGALAANMSGGKAGKGALIGAGTNVIGGALLDTLTSSSTRGQPVPAYARPHYAPPSPNAYRVEQPVYYAEEPVAYTPPQPKKRITRKFGSSGKVVSEEVTWE